MRNGRFPSVLTEFHISNVLPISMYEKFHEGLECSDKLVLPYEILLCIKQIKIPLPPVFTIGYLNSYIPVLCGVTEFTAPMGTAYCPDWILKKMTKKPSLFLKDAVVELLTPKKNKTCVYPGLRKIEIFCSSIIDPASCKTALLRYTIISKGEWVTIWVNHTSIQVHIIGLLPKNKCLLKSKNFEIQIIENSPQATIEKFQIPEINPLIESIHIPMIKTANNKHRSEKAETNTSNDNFIFPQTSRMISMKFDSRSHIDSGILPWDKEETIRPQQKTQVYMSFYKMNNLPTLPQLSTPRKIDLQSTFLRKIAKNPYCRCKNNSMS